MMLLSRHQMIETHKFGTITTRLEPLETSIRTMLSKSKMLEDQTMSESTAQIVNGTRSGDSLETTSKTQETTSHLMLKVEETLKDKQFGLGSHTKERTNNGIFFILKTRKQTPQSSIKALRSTNHSLLFQECQ
jgi:hypothetical protein